MIKIILVGAGGFAGSACRYLVGELSRKYVTLPVWLYPTLIVNVVGCFLIGLILGLSETRSFLTPEVRALVVVGFLGGFTTFSTFGYETFALGRGDQILPALVNILMHVMLGLLAVAAGFWMSKLV
jgi:CrcB protein